MNPVESSGPMRVAIAGASGLIGTALGAALREAGHVVLPLVRRAAAAEHGIAWDPARGELDAARLAGVDAIVNLAGENIGAGRWTAARREAIRNSRLAATRTLAQAVGRLGRRPAVWVNASAVGIYGDRGDEVLDETSRPGTDFLAEVCQDWERETLAVAALGLRVVRLRLGVVLARQGGALPRMLSLFRCGLGGRLGSGRQWLGWIALDDVVRAILHLMTDPEAAGGYNLVAPEPVTNAEFTRALGAVLGRPAVLPVPMFVLRTVLGKMADGTVLASTRAVPSRLLAAGFRFEYPEIAGALHHVLRG